MTCEFTFCRFCGHGNECSANGHQQSQCEYKELLQAYDILKKRVGQRDDIFGDPVGRVAAPNITIDTDTLHGFTTTAATTMDHYFRYTPTGFGF